MTGFYMISASVMKGWSWGEQSNGVITNKNSFIYINAVAPETSLTTDVMQFSFFSYFIIVYQEQHTQKHLSRINKKSGNNIKLIFAIMTSLQLKKIKN